MEELVKRVLDCAYEVHRNLMPGYLEAVYEQALKYELQQANIPFESQKKIIIRYKDTIVGEYIADLIVDNLLIVELKAVGSLNKNHEIQLVNYLTATGIDDGLLINFGSDYFEAKRKYRLPKGQLEKIDRQKDKRAKGIG